MKYSEVKIFEYKNYFQLSPFYCKVFCDAECSCDYTIEKKNEITENVCLQKPVSFN